VCISVFGQLGLDLSGVQFVPPCIMVSAAAYQRLVNDRPKSITLTPLDPSLLQEVPSYDIGAVMRCSCTFGQDALLREAIKEAYRREHVSAARAKQAAATAKTGSKLLTMAMTDNEVIVKVNIDAFLWVIICMIFIAPCPACVCETC
jgi:hypothetical protein